MFGNKRAEKGAAADLYARVAHGASPMLGLAKCWVSRRARPNLRWPPALQMLGLAKGSTQPTTAARPPSPHELARAGCEQFVRRHRFGDDALRERVGDELVEHAPVRRDAVGKRIAGDLHHPAVHLVDVG